MRHRRDEESEQLDATLGVRADVSNDGRSVYRKVFLFAHSGKRSGGKKIALGAILVGSNR
jgi:hypothetical protein